MKPEETGVADLTQEAGLEEPSDSELFANLTSRMPPASGLHRRPREALAQVARLGALAPSMAPRRSVVPPPAGPRVSTARAIVSKLESGAFDDDEPTPGRQLVPMRKTGLSRAARVAIAVAGGALVLLLLVAVIARSSARTGSLIVTATGPGSSEVTGIEVLVDGEKHCLASPCRIGSIEPGTHMVNVRAKGFNPTASLAVAVTARTESALNVALSPVLALPAAPSIAAALESSRPAEPARPPDQLANTKRAEAAPAASAPNPRVVSAPIAAQPRSAPSANQAPGAAAASSAATEKSDSGMLRIVSIPVASVLVDGRPIGSTPKVVRVSPGQHRVAIVAGEDRRAQTVTIAAGATQVVSVRF